MTMTAASPNNGAIQQRPNASNALAMPAKEMNTLRSLIEAQKDKLAAVLPKHLPPEKLMRVVLVAVSKSKDLQECTIGSILQCVMTSAQLGLDCSGVLGSAYMVPFFNSKTGQKEAQFIPGYRGLIDLARRSGEIEDISAHCVYAEDDFVLELGADPKLIHRPNLLVGREDDKIVGAYMVAYLKGNARPHIEFVPRADIDKVRASSKAGKFGPWKDWFAEMARKTAIRRGVKYLPMSVDLAEAVAADETSETRVISAETQSAKARSLAERITSRPVSESQVFTPDPEAIEQAHQEAEQAALEQEQSQTNEDVQRPDAPTLIVDDWPSTLESCAMAGATAGLSAVDVGTRVNLWVLNGRFKGKEETIPVPQRIALVEAIAGGKLGADGKIAQ